MMEVDCWKLVTVGIVKEEQRGFTMGKVWAMKESEELRMI